MSTWPLAKNNFGLIDRLKICGFFLNYKNRWSQDKYVREFEQYAAAYVGSNYAIFVSSGSTANTLIAQQVKDKLIEKGEWPKRNKVIVNAVTWQTNVSVWVREGFEPVFIDVTLEDFCLDYDKLDEYLGLNQDSVACVFPTAVLGYTVDIDRLISICSSYSVELRLDGCEGSELKFFGKNILAYCTSSTSTFVAHQWSNGQEGGFIFTNSKEEYEYFLLSRAHGLKRNLIPYLDTLDKLVLTKYTNTLVDPQFDFQTLSSNYRNSEIGAFCGLLDSKKWGEHRDKRINLYEIFKKNLSLSLYFLPNDRLFCRDVAFCLPIILNPKVHSPELIAKVKKTLDEIGIERRSFISGNMLRQKPYRKYGNYLDYPIAEYLNNFAVYIGLNYDLKEEDIIKLCNILNKL